MSAKPASACHRFRRPCKDSVRLFQFVERASVLYKLNRHRDTVELTSLHLITAAARAKTTMARFEHKVNGLRRLVSSVPRCDFVVNRVVHYSYGMTDVKLPPP